MKASAGIVMLLLIVAVLGAQDAARAQDRHVDELALQIQKRASDVCWELHRNYRRQHDYRVVYRECYEMYTLAKNIHDIAHHGGSARRISRYVGELDELFHHLEEHFHEWAVPNWHHHGDHVGHGSHHDTFGDVRHTRLARKMNGLGEALHHLMEDLDIVSQYTSPYDPPRPSGGSVPPQP